MKTVLVTGGTTRLGLAIAHGLAAAGWRVVVSSHRPDAGADIVADLSAPGGAESLFASAVALCGGVPPDALVNNAALFFGDDAMVERVNYAAPVRLIELMAGGGRGGSAVNILDSRVLREGFKPACRYDETKARLLAATLALARNFAGRLRVNAVAPGPVLAPVGVSEKAARCPFGRPAPADVAAAVAYLASAGATTGCIIPVDGGESAVARG